MIRLMLPSESTTNKSGGASGRTLVQKLGIKAGWRLLVLNPPPGYQAMLTGLPEDCVFVTAEDAPPVEFVHFFSRRRTDVEQTLQTLRQRIVPHGMIWVSWPKKSSGVRTDLDENIIRDIALASQLVDVKVAAVDQVWSGLKLVIRLRDR